VSAIFYFLLFPLTIEIVSKIKTFVSRARRGGVSCRSLAVVARHQYKYSLTCRRAAYYLGQVKARENAFGHGEAVPEQIVSKEMKERYRHA
jgi:hypothetical protein